MDIGGSDLIIPTSLNVVESSTLVKKLSQEYWPNVVFEVVDTTDIFIYEDLESKKSWDEDCAIGKANMIYALFRDKFVTLVYDVATDSEVLCKKVEDVFQNYQS